MDYSIYFLFCQVLGLDFLPGNGIWGAPLNKNLTKATYPDNNPGVSTTGLI